MTGPEAAPTLPAPRDTGEEARLLNRLRHLQEDRSAYFAVHVHLSALRRVNRTPEVLGRAAAAAGDVAAGDSVDLYRLDNGDMVLLCRDAPVGDIDRVLDRVRGLFRHDPLSDGVEGALEDRFSTWYDLSRTEDFTALRKTVGGLAGDALERRRAAALRLAPGTLPGRDLEAGDVAAIVGRIDSVGLDGVLYEQAAVEVHADDRGELLFREQFVAIGELQKRIAPGINLFSHAALFQHLTEAIDRRLLGAVAEKISGGGAGTVSINLNISTVLGEDFRAFHRRAEKVSERVIVELQPMDIFADPGAFASARNLLRDNGYRVLIDGLAPLSWRLFDPGLLGADLLKMNWTPEFRDDSADLKQAVRRAGAERVILGRAEGEDAVGWALSLGIRRFQGFFIDGLVEAMSAKGILRA